MFSFSKELALAHTLKEEYCRLFDSTYRADFKERLRLRNTLKRVCYGFRNFENFRRRILHILNNDARKTVEQKQSEFSL